MKLQERQKRFADFYIESGNITESAIKAGYSETYANAQGYKLLENVGIKAYIGERLSEKDKNRIASQDEVLHFLTKVLRGEETEKLLVTGKDYFDLVDNTPSIRDRTKAAELLGKRYTLWTDRQQIEGNIGVTIVDDIDD